MIVVKIVGPFQYFLINFFQSITQSFHKTLSRINIRTRNKISAGVLIIRGRINYTRGRASQKLLNFYSKKSHSAENCRTVAKMNHSPSLYIAEHTRFVPKTKKLSAANQNRV